MSRPANPYAFAAFAENCGQVGMTLRDWFAGQALAGRMINGFASSADANTHARVSYAIADAMLAERVK